MDRACRSRVGRVGRWGGDLRTAVPLVVLAAACTVLTGDLGRTIAIEIDGAPVRMIEENDSITLSARAIDAAGDTISDAVIVWELLNGGSVIQLDSVSGIVRADFPGSGSVRARVDMLRSDTISIVVTGAPDSILIDGDTLITIAPDVDVSSPLEVSLIDLTTDAADAQPLANKPVTFAVSDPPPGTDEVQGLFLSEIDSEQGPDPHSLTVTTDETAIASVVARRAAGATLPDTVVVDAVAVTAVGDTVAGSPVSFFLVFESGA